MRAVIRVRTVHNWSNIVNFMVNNVLMLHCHTHSCRLRLCGYFLRVYLLFGKSPELLYSMRSSNYHRYFIYPRRPPPPPPSVKVVNCVILLWKSFRQSKVFQETFFLFFASWNCAAASANCDAGPFFSIFLVLHN